MKPSAISPLNGSIVISTKLPIVKDLIEIVIHTSVFVGGSVSSLHSGIEFGRTRTGEGRKKGLGWCEKWARSG